MSTDPAPLNERWTRFVLRHRWLILGIWVVILVTGGTLSSGLSKLLSNEFTVPGTDSEDVRATLEERFGQRDDGSFLVVFRVEDSSDPATRRQLQAALGRGAAVLDGGQVQPLQTAGRNVVFGTIGMFVWNNGPRLVSDVLHDEPGRAHGA